MIVVDSNIIGYLYLNSDRSSQAEQALRKDPQWAAHLLRRSELRNVLALYIHKRLLSLEAAQKIMDEAVSLMIGQEYEVVSSQVLNSVAKSMCSAHDWTECIRVTSSDVMNLSDVFPTSPPCSGNLRFLSCPFLVHRIQLSDVYVKHEFFFVGDTVM